VRESDSAQIGFDVVSKVILSLFTVELMVSMFCHGWKNFWKDWWNRFDLFIIVFGWPIEFVNASTCSHSHPLLSVDIGFQWHTTGLTLNG